MKRLEQVFARKQSGVLAVYLTAGYPNLHSTGPLIRELAAAGADIIEVGIPFSDPLADGPTIQASNAQALENGMSLSLALAQIAEVRASVDVPIVLMGYLNQVMQFGEQQFCEACAAAGVDGLILPDMPPAVYRRDYQTLFEAHDLRPTFLVAPNTDPARIREIDALSHGFVYTLSAAAITGGTGGLQTQQAAWFEQLESMNLQKPRLIGFGISSPQDFEMACQYSAGAIVGSAFIRAIGANADPADFVRTLKHKVDGRW